MGLRTERKNTKRLKNFWGHSVELVDRDIYQAIVWSVVSASLIALDILWWLDVRKYKDY